MTSISISPRELQRVGECGLVVATTLTGMVAAAKNTTDKRSVHGMVTAGGIMGAIYGMVLVAIPVETLVLTAVLSTGYWIAENRANELSR